MDEAGAAADRLTEAAARLRALQGDPARPGGAPEAPTGEVRAATGGPSADPLERLGGALSELAAAAVDLGTASDRLTRAERALQGFLGPPGARRERR